MANMAKYNARVVQKHDTKANWDKATNFIPLPGEIIVYDDLDRIKIGDGTTTVVNLPFSIPTKEEVGLGNVDNTSDADKPVSSAMQAALDEKQDTITGGATTIALSNLTKSRALISNSSGKVAVSAVTSTELEYLDGVTNNVQTQLDAKVPTTRTINNKELSDNISLTASDVNAAPAYQYGTTDLTAGTSSLATGTLYFLYE